MNMKKQKTEYKLTKRQYEQWQQYEKDKLYGRIISPESLRLLCAACNWEEKEIGRLVIMITKDYTKWEQEQIKQIKD